VKGSVSTFRRLDHLRRAVDRRQPAAVETFAHEGRRNPVPAPNLENPVIRTDVELLDDRSQAFTHDGVGDRLSHTIRQ
jgi:hypothetical protein